MNSFESIMPPLGLCKLLAEKLPGVLNDTALVWSVYPNGTIKRRERPYFDTSDLKIIYPAPTLAEIQRILPPGTTVMMDAPAVWAAISGAGTRDVKIEKDETPESAALRLLFKINGIEVK